MAVAKMTKIGIFGYLPEIDQVVDSLQNLGAVHITPIDQAKKLEEPDAQRSLQRVERAIETLRDFHSAKQEKLKIKSLSEFLISYDWDAVVERVTDLKGQIDSSQRHIVTTERSLHELKPYLSLEITRQEIEASNRTKVFIGQIPVGQWEGFVAEMSELPLATFEKIDDRGADIYFIAYFHVSSSNVAEDILLRYEFSSIDLGLLLQRPRITYEDKARDLKETRLNLMKKKEELQDIASENLPSLVGIVDHLKVLSEQQSAMGLADSSTRVFYMTGWLKKKDLEGVSEKLTKKFPVTEIREIQAFEGEEPPVALSNPRWIEPFEILTNMYGRPRMGMIDPTPWTGPFFALFFAFCMTDAGYGLILALLGGLALAIKGRELPRSTNNFLKLILYVGVLTIFAGIIAGSYFGFNPSSVESPGGIVSLMLKLKLFDPLDNALLFFSISVIFGMIQLAIGFGLSAYVKITEAKNTMLKAKETVLGLSWISISLGLGVFIIYNLKPELVESINPIAIKAIFGGMGGILVGSLVLGIAGGQSVGSAIGGAIGFDGLYGITGLFGDILSYARILALGISTGVIAGVINSLGGMLAGGSIILGIVAALFLVVGHIGYTALSALSAFIHPLRLQYVEYFGKFYEAGGNDFKPLEKHYENIEKTT